MADQNKAEIKTIEKDPKDFTEDEILELFRSADDASRQAALVILKCEKPQLGDVISLVSGVMKGEGAKGKKAVDALTALSVMMKNKDIDLRQLQDLAAAASGLINSTHSDQSDNDQDTSDNSL